MYIVAWITVLFGRHHSNAGTSWFQQFCVYDLLCISDTLNTLLFLNLSDVDSLISE